MRPARKLRVKTRGSLVNRRAALDQLARGYQEWLRVRRSTCDPAKIDTT